MEVGLGAIDRIWAITCAGRRSGGSLDCEVCFKSGFHINVLAHRVLLWRMPTNIDSDRLDAIALSFEERHYR
jgi:hypothetical protein